MNAAQNEWYVRRNNFRRVDWRPYLASNRGDFTTVQTLKHRATEPGGVQSELNVCSRARAEAIGSRNLPIASTTSSSCEGTMSKRDLRKNPLHCVCLMWAKRGRQVRHTPYVQSTSIREDSCDFWILV